MAAEPNLARSGVPDPASSGDSPGIPVHMRVGDNPEQLVGTIAAPSDLPDLLRMAAGVVETLEPDPDALPSDGRRQTTIEIEGVWLLKSTAHNGNGIEVLVQLADGTYHVAITDTADDGPISHYVHPSGILAAPVRSFDETVAATR